MKIIVISFFSLLLLDSHSQDSNTDKIVPIVRYSHWLTFYRPNIISFDNVKPNLQNYPLNIGFSFKSTMGKFPSGYLISLEYCALNKKKLPTPATGLLAKRNFIGLSAGVFKSFGRSKYFRFSTAIDLQLKKGHEFFFYQVLPNTILERRHLSDLALSASLDWEPRLYKELHFVLGYRQQFYFYRAHKAQKNLDIGSPKWVGTWKIGFSFWIPGKKNRTIRNK